MTAPSSPQTGSWDKVRILNLDIDNVTFAGLLAELKEGVVFTPNVDHLMKLQQDREFYELYTQAEYLTCDSRIMQVTSAWVSKSPIREQIAGSDFFPAFCQYHRANTGEMKVYLLGGTTPEAVEEAWVNLNRKTASNLIIGGYSPPFGFENNPVENDKIIERINASGATVLAVGLGCPKQEKWIMHNRQRLPGVKIFFAIGATIDFQAGRLHRSPRWITKIGLEWLYRMFQEPKRMVKRYLVDDLPYFFLLWRQRRNKYVNPWEDRRAVNPL